MLEPVGSFLLHGLRLGIVLQAQGPLLEAATDRQRLQGFSLLQALIGQAQLLQEDAPGDGVNHQVVADQQQAPGLGPGQVEEHGSRQWPGSQMQAGLLLVTALLHAASLLLLGQLAQVHHVEGDRLILRQPLPAHTMQSMSTSMDGSVNGK